jgi:hypothetical protein
MLYSAIKDDLRGRCCFYLPILHGTSLIVVQAYIGWKGTRAVRCSLFLHIPSSVIIELVKAAGGYQLDYCKSTVLKSH